MVKPPKTSKEINDIKKAIEQYHKKHKGNISFIASFMAFKGEDCEVVDDIILAYGSKEEIEIALEGLGKEVKKEKKDFINW